MLDFSNKKFATILQDMLFRIPSDLNKREGSLIRTSLSAAAWAIEGIFLELAYIQKQAFALFATGEYLDYKAAERGLTRKKATPSKREGVFNIQPPLGSRFSTKDLAPPLYYVVTADLPSHGENKHAELTCETDGVVGDLYSGSLLSAQYIPGLIDATLSTVLIEGTDEETDDAFRVRYKDSMGQIPFGGNIASYRREVLAIPGVGAVQVWPANSPWDYVECIILDENLDIATPTLMSVVQDILDPMGYQGVGYGLAPIGAMVQVVTAGIDYIDIGMDVEFKAGYNADNREDAAREVIEKYLKEVCKQWGAPASKSANLYSVKIYMSQIIIRMMTLEGVLNVSNVAISGVNDDYSVHQGKGVSCIPILRNLYIGG